MKFFYGICLLSAGLLLTACNDSQNDPQVLVDDLETGAYTVSVGDENDPTVGKYYAGADGSRFLVLNDSDGRATRLYRRAAGGDWVAVPRPEKDVKVTLLHSDLLPTITPTTGSLSGTYVARLASGDTASFSVNSAGEIIAGDSSCKISGQLATGQLPNTLRLTLKTSGCDALPGSSSGILTTDTDDAPAVFRLLADDGARLVDILAYAE